ncbi:MAG: Gfo/Idh/MocA family oxidoreductase [Planctomycetes bacterium]|nr:Gfo/Idh/MocA family oxidoreductase [Planctomycetota bacterium]
MRSMTRREFVGGSLAAGGALAAVAPFSRVLGANDAIRIGMVGLGSKVKIGGKGKADLREFRRIPGVRIAALCDVDRAILDAEVKACEAQGEKVEAHADVRKLLDSRAVDAISIATPNHWHALATVWGCQAGKDVHVQKPASHNIYEGRKMVEAMRKHGRIVQASAGPRSATGFGEAYAFVREGSLGKILLARGINYKPRMSIGKVAGPRPVPEGLDYDLWSGPAPLLPVRREYLHYDWHWFWPYGDGDLGNMGIHYMDACRWALGQQTLPERVISIGGRFGYDDDGETPNTQITFLDYRPAPIIFEVRGLPKDRRFLAQAWERHAGETMDRYRDIQIGAVIHCEGGAVVNNKAFDRAGKLIRQFAPTNTDLLTDFIQAVRSRKPADLATDALQGHLSAALVHMANISFRAGEAVPGDRIRAAIEGQKEFAEAFDRFRAHLDANGIDLEKTPPVLGARLRFDPEAERFVGPGSERANPLLSRPYRRPFAVPEEV